MDSKSVRLKATMMGSKTAAMKDEKKELKLAMKLATMLATKTDFRKELKLASNLDTNLARWLVTMKVKRWEQMNLEEMLEKQMASQMEQEKVMVMEEMLGKKLEHN